MADTGDLSRVELEAELRRERQAHAATAKLLDLVMGQLPAFYWVLDRDLRVLRNGGAIDQLMGFSAASLVGRTLHDIMAQYPGSSDTVALHERALAGERLQFEREYRDKLVATIIGPYRSDTGEIIGVVGTSMDVTAWRALERRMVDAQRAESLGVLAGGLAHDFNNLLVAVLGNADLAARELPDDHPATHAIDNIRTAGLRAAELTDELLAYAGRGGAGTTRIEPRQLVDELVRILGPAIPDTVRVDIDIPEQLAVRGDPVQLRQVLLNLFNNARDALRARTGRVSLRGESLHHDGAADPDDILTATAGSYVVLEVADDGPGMNSETRRHVFEPFFTTKQTGHGLGLAAVLGIVRAHGGGLRVTSAPGAGARFQVLWPAAVTSPLSSITEPPSVAARTVLVIDDEDLVRDVVARMVEDLGYTAVTARDGQAGLDVLARQPVDAVLVDMTMPRMSGVDVVAAVREHKPGIPVVVCSGYERDARGPIQADAYLAKPFRLEALERTLAKLLPLRSV